MAEQPTPSNDMDQIAVQRAITPPNLTGSKTMPAAVQEHSTLSLEHMCDDIMRHILDASAGTNRGQCRNACKLQIVSKGLKHALKPFASELVERASLKLVTGTSPLNLTHMQLDDFDCRLLALALANNRLDGVHSLWLQDNAIGAAGLRWLARGLRSMPAGGRLRSVSLGHNSFVPAATRVSSHGAGRHEKNEQRRAVDLAMAKLEAAAAQHRVCIRLFS